MLLQVGIALAIALAIVRTSGDTGAWLVPIAAGVFIAIQYAVIALTILLSRALASGEDSQRSLVPALHAAITEPIYFGLAQLAMIAARSTRPVVLARVPESDGSPVLLVHGLACNHGIWRWLVAGLRAAGFGSIYAVDLVPPQADMDVLARQLGRELLRIHQAHERSRITIIAHSMGGLVARSALGCVAPQAIRRIITIGTPHHGAAIARTLRWQSARQMCPASSWLTALNAQQEGRLAVPLTSIGSVDDNMVTPCSSIHLQDATVREMRGLGHFGLLISRRAIACVLRALKEAP
jgi:predicted alpha/beta hydrolase family esterase